MHKSSKFSFTLYFHIPSQPINREEKSLHHVAVVAQFLNDKKTKTSLKKWIRIVLDVIDLIQFHLICQLLAKSSVVESESTVISTEKEKENFVLCSPTS